LKTQSTWRKFVQSITSEFTFHPPASVEDIEKAESSLDVTFPDTLKTLLQGSDGIEGSYGLGLIWNVQRIADDNLFFRQFSEYKDLYMPFDHLLFIADAGNGDQFAFPVLNGKIQKRDIYVWNHVEDSRQWVAPSLDLYLEWWLNGKIKI
jgi:hypothetical protein